MEKQAKPKNNIPKFISKAASAVITFQNPPPFSPVRDKRSYHTNKLKAYVGGKAISGPLNLSTIPYEVRKQIKNSSFEAQQDPTSPKISCIGQIKQKKKKKKKMRKANKPPLQTKKPSSPRETKKNKTVSKIKRLFVTIARPHASGTKSGAPSKLRHEYYWSRRPGRAPALSQMKRFASGRDHHSLANFDWTTQITPTDNIRDNSYSDEEDQRIGYSTDEEDEEVNVTFSAPLSVGSGFALQPRKEVNLWKRRTMDPPRPLRLI